MADQENSSPKALETPETPAISAAEQAEDRLKSLIDLLADLNLDYETQMTASKSVLENLGSNNYNRLLTGLQDVVMVASEEPSPLPETKKTPQQAKSTSEQDNNNLPSASNYWQEKIATLEAKLAVIESQLHQPTQIINPLLPLITELMQLKMETARETILEAVVPVIDQVIEQRTFQDRYAMGAALSLAIPEAIRKETKDCPQEIARAIAPEIALAIEEQIKLNKDAISKALGPEMGKAIKTQIAVEKDSMVDALYPVIGSTVSKYMVEVVNSINYKVENSFSPQGIARKFRAKIQGVSEAELILKESVTPKVKAAFLIHKASGLLIAEVQTSENLKMESDLFGGMLTAIRSFANDCITSSDNILELNEIEYGDHRIILEVAGYCYLALVVQGETPFAFVKEARQTLSEIVSHYDQIIYDFDGDRTTVPHKINELLTQLAISKSQEETRVSKPPFTLLVILLLALGGIFIPWSIYQYHQQKLENQINYALQDFQDLSFSPIEAKVRRDTITLKGRVPLTVLKNQAATVAQDLAPDLKLDNHIVAVKLLREPIIIGAAIDLLSEHFNQQPGVNIKSDYEAGVIKVSGGVFVAQDRTKIIQSLEQIPGISIVENNIELRELKRDERIYFKTGSGQVKPEDVDSKIIPVADFMRQNPDVKVRIIGHTDAVGLRERNQFLAKERANSVQQALIEQGIEAQRIKIMASSNLPPGVTPEQDLWLSRCVRFEPFLPHQ